MNNLTITLLGGAAISALASTSAMAGAIATTHYATPNVTALHAGNSVLKTRIHNPKSTHVTYTYADYTYVPASDLNVNLQLLSTYWKFNSSGNICSNPKTKIKIKKSATYGTASTGTYTEQSGTCVIVFHGDNYELTNSAGEGQKDSFSSKMQSKFKVSGAKYRGIIRINETVTIG